jgi:hypothetical protein
LYKSELNVGGEAPESDGCERREGMKGEKRPGAKKTFYPDLLLASPGLLGRNLKYSKNWPG